ncbi:hypothetical protein [Streptomyces sp. NPDC001978]|uniref:hypothetical protein n=1 Tax=Streptomyces sp. NPDC001978 TaxID=3364627 RepID=UPI00369AD5A9
MTDLLGEKLTGSDIERAASSGFILPATADLTAPAEFTREVLAKLQELEDRSLWGS